MKLRMKDNGVLVCEKDGNEGDVFIKQCFPWSNPNQYLSIQNKEGVEVWLVKDVNDLEKENRRILHSYLKLIQFVIEVKKVISVDEDVELRNFKVDTYSGERIFQTKLDDWPMVKENGELLIQDLGGDLFRIKDISRMDEDSLKHLEPFIN